MRIDEPRELRRNGRRVRPFDRFEGPMTFVGRPLFNPFPENCNLTIGERFAAADRRHLQLGIASGNAAIEFAFVRLAGSDHSSQSDWLVEQQIRLAFLYIGPMAEI